VSQGRDDSPPAGNEATSDGNRDAPTNPIAGDAASDDLVSVDPRGAVDVGGDDPPAPARGNLTIESGSAPGRAVYWLLKNVLLGPVITKVFHPIQEGAQHVPDEGAAIIASNHLSFADWLFMPLVLDRRITFVAKSDYFTRAGLKGWFQKRFFAGTGQVPIDRSGGRASESALRAGLKVLQRGELFGIYPEGTRSHDGRLYKGRTGVARLALLSGVSVIPSAIIGTDIIAPPGKIITKIVSPTVKFGESLDFSRYEGMSEDRFILRSITDEIMYAIMELSGQEYVDMYAPAAKEAADREAKAHEVDEVSPQA
jgi:1-acyl-sn-glycerol-3-phosphate acyltransferase